MFGEPSLVAIAHRTATDGVCRAVSRRFGASLTAKPDQRDHLGPSTGSNEQFGARRTMKQKDLRAHIIREWDHWLASQSLTPGTATGRDSLKFYFELQDKRSSLLDFQSRGRDKWQIVHAWLLSEHRVMD